MKKLGSFGLDGVVIDGTGYFTSYRREDVIVLDFCNNVLLPLKVRESGLYIEDVEIVKMSERFDVIALGVGVGTTHSIIWLESGDERTEIEADSGTIVASAGIRVETDAWLAKCGVLKVVGASEGFGTWSHGCTIEILRDRLIVRLSNKWYFPVMFQDGGVEVAGKFVKVKLGNPVVAFVRELYKSDEEVQFRLTFDTVDGPVVCDPIIYGLKTVRYADSCVSTYKYVKQLFLEGLE